MQLVFLGGTEDKKVTIAPVSLGNVMRKRDQPIQFLFLVKYAFSLQALTTVYR
jgi:hypothetical protein